MFLIYADLLLLLMSAWRGGRLVRELKARLGLWGGHGGMKPSWPAARDIVRVYIAPLAWCTYRENL